MTEYEKIRLDVAKCALVAVLGHLTEPDLAANTAISYADDFLKEPGIKDHLPLTEYRRG